MMRSLKTLALLSVCLIAACQATDRSSDLNSRPGSGFEGGGVPPMAESTEVIFTKSLDQGLLQSPEWSTVQTLIKTIEAKKGPACVDAFEDNDVANLQVVGVLPSAFNEAAAAANIVKPAGVQFVSSSHYEFCSQMDFVNIADANAATVLNSMLAKYGTSKGGPLNELQALSLTCGPDSARADAAIGCWVLTSEGQASRADADSAKTFYAYLQGLGTLRPLVADTYGLANVSCGEMEVFGPMGRVLRCSFKTALQPK